MQVTPGKFIYFISDFHLGAPTPALSRPREKKLVDFLDEILPTTEALFILGDMFDFWFEYKYVVPKGYVRLLGKLAAFADAGIPIHFFVGNHDMWVKNYFQQELNMKVYHEGQFFTFHQKQFFIAHGDGLGPGDHGYKFLKKVFRNPLCQWVFGMLPPTLGMGLAHFFSRKSREAVTENEQHFLGADKEWLMIYSREKLKEARVDYFVYGHRHVPGIHSLSNESTYVNLGDWVMHYTYGCFDGNCFDLKKYVP
jgi:UDP-2,3-diacylglucosamine hydrolase